MKNGKGLRCMVVLVVICMLGSGVGYADVGEGADTKELMKTIKDLQKEIKGLEEELTTLRVQVKQKPDISRSLQDQIEGLQKEVQSMRDIQGQQVRLPDVPQAGVEIPSWIAGTHFGGDLRVRLQNDWRNKTNDRHRGRIRLRYGISKQVNEELLAAFRLATGDGQDRRNNNATMGAVDQGFDKLNVWIDHAYLKYTPNWLDNFSVYAGKFAPNWKNKKILIFESNPVGFDGLGQSYVYKFNDKLKADINLAQLIFGEGLGSDSDGELYVFDGGLSGSFDTDTSPITWGLRGTAYLFSGLSEVDTGSATPTLTGANAAPTMGNPRTLVGTVDLGFKVADIPVSLFSQGGMNVNEHAEGTAVRDQDKFYSFGACINKLKKPGDWSLGYQFAYLERNVMPSQLPDIDLAVGQHCHWIVLGYKLFKSTKVTLKLIAPRPLDGDKDTERLLSKLNVVTKF